MIFTRVYLFSNSNYFSFVHSSETRIVPNVPDVRVCRRIPGYFRCGAYSDEDSIVDMVGVISAKGQTENPG